MTHLSLNESPFIQVSHTYKQDLTKKTPRFSPFTFIEKVA